MQEKLQEKPFVKIVEVGPRDGLQFEKDVNLPLGTRIELIDRLSACGFPEIEVGSFVSPQWVPQMAATPEIFAGLTRKAGVSYTALVPNQKGFEKALERGVESIAVFTSATETFAQKNINCSIEESFNRFGGFVAEAKERGLWVRGYISCAFFCPYEGEVSPEAVGTVLHRLLDLGMDEISLGDTIGRASPLEVIRLLDYLQDPRMSVPMEKIAMHFHDTFGLALANVCASLDRGVRIFDGSLGGLGGCPYAPGASGNVATESLVYLMDRLGYSTGISLEALLDVARWVNGELGRVSTSHLLVTCQK